MYLLIIWMMFKMIVVIYKLIYIGVMMKIMILAITCPLS